MIKSLISRQEHVVDITARDRIASFRRKLEFWERCEKKRHGDCFPTVSGFLIESNQEDTVWRHQSTLCNRRFRNISHILPVTLPVSKIHIVFQISRMACLCKITSVWKILHLILAWNKDSLSFLWLNSGAVFFKNIRSCLKVHCSDCFHLPQIGCAKLDV